MDHAVRTSKTKAWNKLRFENEELECLYQRYTLKMQRFSVIGVVSLFVIFCMTMVTLSYVFSSLLTLHVRIFLINIVKTILNAHFYRFKFKFHFLLLFQNIFNSLMCLLFLIILALLQFRVIQDSYLLLLCYGILLAATILCVMSMPALNKIIPIDTKEVRVLLFIDRKHFIFVLYFHLFCKDNILHMWNNTFLSFIQCHFRI